MRPRSLLTALKRRLRGSYKFYEFIAPIFGLYRNARMSLARLTQGIDGELVVFSAFDGRSYNDNPRYISEALHTARPRTKIAWLFADVQKARARFDIPAYVQVLDAIGRDGVSALARARVAVDNFNKRFYLNFPAKGQIYINTWHGDRPFKKIGYDDAARHRYMLEERCDLVLAGSDFGEEVLRSALGYRGEVMKLGCPRNDMLVRNDPAQRAAIRAGLGLREDERALLYAPTFRDADMAQHRRQSVPLDLCHVLDTLQRSTGARWKCLVRGHYYVGGLDVSDPEGRLIPASDYPEMAELLLAADALLTDYSSCASDFVLLRRPIYLYQDDIEDYERHSRGLYRPMSDYAYWVAHTPEELDALIEHTTPERAAQNCERIMADYGMHESGRATEAVVRYIISKLDGTTAVPDH